MRRRWNRYAIEVAALRVLRPLGIAFFVLITVFPFYYMVLLSVRDISEIIESPGSIIVGLGELSTDAYERVLKPTSEGGEGFLRFLLNSLLLAAGTVVVTLLVSILGAYAVSRLEFFGRRAVHFLFLSVYLFPAILLAIPLFVAFSKMGLRGELWVLVIVYVAQTLPICVYMLRNYFETVPVSLEEAAEVDGATRMQIIRKITLPLAIPAIAATGLFVFMIAWNEFLFALLFLVEERPNWTVSLGVSQLTNIETPATTLMAGSVILTVPIIVLFLFAERLMTEGLTRGAEKG
ncbi:carbohydrate ABC transporter permease [Solirubrobacter sp. CPCC 204708]|uniref:Carbohydrate ABC transporter permease n=1 Tax=Solirubrobacter deserti TaxID=2282478 RepID=A0ABT4RS70_9ACTN|nr:carbohydrate ABC transporter permease [Solirubrobacter deserti]MBE2314341.1 carbohydrate ABC transporter permease [Solirubrobacter deserti]MDA0141439.1 carbohydrate ABC transporter permease [Solirubrobacter deserti]